MEVKLTSKRITQFLNELNGRIDGMKVTDLEMFVTVIGYGVMIAKERALCKEDFFLCVQDVWNSILTEDECGK